MRKAFIHITNDCNYNCLYCYSRSGKDAKSELTDNEILTLCEYLFNTEIGKIVFTGGEPFLKTNFLNILEKISKGNSSNIPICINSNGSQINKPISEVLIGLVDEVRISIDSTEKRNDSIRTKGSYYNAVKAFTHLLEAGFEPIASITVTKFNYRSIPRLVADLEIIGVKRFSLLPFREIGRGELLFKNIKLEAYYEHIYKKLCKDTSIVYSRGNTRIPLNHCGVGHFINILANGDVYPCYALQFPFFFLGNIRKQPFHSIFNNQLLNKLSALDFPALSQKSIEFSGLLKPYSCFGEVFKYLEEKNHIYKELM